MDERDLRRINPQEYPKNLRQTIYYAKDCLRLKKEAEKELEHAKTYRKRALEITIKEADNVIRSAIETIESKKLTKEKDNEVNIGKKIVSAIVSGEIRHVERKRGEN